MIARPLRPITSESTDSSLMLASSNVFCRRCTWLAFSRTSCLRVRSSPRSSWISGPGTKLARIAPAVEERFAADEERAGLQLGEGGESGVDLAFAAGLHDTELH